MQVGVQWLGIPNLRYIKVVYVIVIALIVSVDIVQCKVIAVQKKCRQLIYRSFLPPPDESNDLQKKELRNSQMRPSQKCTVIL